MVVVVVILFITRTLSLSTKPLAYFIAFVLLSASQFNRNVILKRPLQGQAEEALRLRLIFFCEMFLSLHTYLFSCFLFNFCLIGAQGQQRSDQDGYRGISMLFIYEKWKGNWFITMTRVNCTISDTCDQCWVNHCKPSISNCRLPILSHWCCPHTIPQHNFHLWWLNDG